MLVYTPKQEWKSGTFTGSQGGLPGMWVVNSLGFILISAAIDLSLDFLKFALQPSSKPLAADIMTPQKSRG